MKTRGSSMLSWGAQTVHNQSGGFGDYLQATPTQQKVEGVVMGVTHGGLGAIAGAMVGGLVTLPIGGVGAGPGAAIGAGVSVLLSAADQTYDAHREYEKSKKACAEQGKENLEEVFLRTKRFNEDNMCGIDQVIPKVPVKIKGEKQVYERATLEAAIKKNGRSPMTQKAVTLKDIEADHHNAAKIGQICDAVLNDGEAREMLEPEQITQAIILRQRALKQAEKECKQKLDQLKVDLDAGKIKLQEYCKKIQEVAEMYDPVVSDGGENPRAEVDPREIVLPPEVLGAPAKQRPVDEAKE